MKNWWNHNDDHLTYCSYKVNQTEVLVGPRIDLDSRGCSKSFFDSVHGWCSVTESYVEYPVEANVRWFPWKEHKEKLPDHVLFGTMKMLNFWINELKLPRIYIHCDLGTHRAPTVLGAFLLGYYPKEFDTIEANRIIFNRKHSTIIGTNGSEHGQPRSYIKSYLREVPLLDTMINTIVKYPRLALDGVVEQAFQERPLHLYTPEEKEEYETNEKQKDYHKKMKEWLVEKGFKLDVNSRYQTLHDIIDAEGNGTHLVADSFRFDIVKSLKKYGQVYFTHNNANISELDLENLQVKEDLNLNNNDLCLIRWVVTKNDNKKQE
jgi:hypothetical protein